MDRDPKKVEDSGDAGVAEEKGKEIYEKTKKKEDIATEVAEEAKEASESAVDEVKGDGKEGDGQETKTVSDGIGESPKEEATAESKEKVVDVEANEGKEDSKSTTDGVTAIPEGQGIKDSASPEVAQEEQQPESVPKEDEGAKPEITVVDVAEGSKPVQTEVGEHTEILLAEESKVNVEETPSSGNKSEENQNDPKASGESKVEEDALKEVAQEETIVKEEAVPIETVQKPPEEDAAKEEPAPVAIVQETPKEEPVAIDSVQETPKEEAPKTEEEPVPIQSTERALQEEEPEISQPEPVSEEPAPSIDETKPDGPEDIEIETRSTQPITHDGQGMDPEILKHIENYLDEIEVTNYDIKMEPGTVAGENSLGIIAKIKINGADRNGSAVEFDWIAKIAPPIEILRKIIKVDALYRNEVLVYESVFRTYKELESEKSIVNAFDSYPEYIFSSLENLKEVVVMTDVKSLGYVSRNPKEPLDLEHVKVVMKAYGKLHALSYAFKEQRPEAFEKVSWICRGNLLNAVDVGEIKKSQEGIIHRTLDTLDPVKHKVAYKKFSRFVQNFMSIYIEASRTTNKYSVIGHGDSWINNMLFKYENTSQPNLPTSVCLLDFQVARYASPVCDLSYFLFTCTDKAFRDVHYDTVIKLYYYSLCAHLTDLGHDPEKILPFDVLEVEFKRYSVVGLYLSLLALMAMIRDADEIGDWQRSTDPEENDRITAAINRNQEVYNERVRDMVLDFAQKGYLDFL